MRMTIAELACIGVFHCVAIFAAGNEQDRAAKAIKQAGASIYPLPSDDKATGGTWGLRFFPKTNPRPTKDVRAVLAEIRHFPNLLTIDMRKVAEDEHMEPLTILKRLGSLELSESAVTDRGGRHLGKHSLLTDLKVDRTEIGDGTMTEIGKLEHLRTLFLHNTRVTDKGVKNLLRLKKLEWLTIGPHTTDAGLVDMAKLTTIKELHVSGKAITGQGIKALAPLKNLQRMAIASDALSNDDLKHMHSFPNLGSLVLDAPRITDDGIAHLVQLKIGTLYLQRTPVTDTGLVQLAGLQSLQSLHLRNTKVTEDGISRFCRLRPNVRVVK